MKNNSRCVINRTKKRRMLTVWGREGKPASLKMWVVLTTKRLRCWVCSYYFSRLSDHNRLINPTRLSATGKRLLLFFYFAGGGIQDRSWRQAVCLGEKNGLLHCGEPQQSQSHGHPAARQVWGERSTAYRTQTTGTEEVTWFISWYYSWCEA